LIFGFGPEGRDPINTLMSLRNFTAQNES